MKKESVVAGTNSTFSEPLDLENAQERIEDLKAEIIQLETSLHNKHVSHPVTGERLSTMEYFTWKRGVLSALDRDMRELGYLRSWIKLKGGAPLYQVRSEAAFRILWRCGQLLRRLDEKGIEFTSEERKLLDDVEDFTGLKADRLLEDARACMRGDPNNVLQFGGMIAKATRNDQDVAVLANEWEKVADRPRNAALIAACAQEYTQVLAYLGRFDEATSVARSLDQTQREAAYAWSAIAQHSGNQDALDRARALGRNLPMGNREWFFLDLYSFSGKHEDAAFADPSPESEPLIGKKLGWFRVLMVKEHVNWGRQKETRSVFRKLNTAEEQMHALAFIAERSKDKDDINRLLSALEQYKPAKLTTMKRVAAVLACNGYGDLMCGVLDSMSTWHFRCAGYSILARFMKDRVPEMLDRAEQVLTSSQFGRGTEESQALYSLVYAQATNRRMAEAIRTAQVIKEREARCSAFLLLNALSRGEAIPDFLVKML